LFFATTGSNQLHTPISLVSRIRKRILTSHNEQTNKRNRTNEEMGNTVSVPTLNELGHIFPIEKDATLPLGMNHGVPNTTCGPPTQIIVKEKVWSVSGDSMLIKHMNGTAFGHSIKVQGKVLSIRDRTVLLNGITNEPVVVSMRKWNSSKTHAFKLYTTHPVYEGHVQSEQKYNKNTPLYTYANIVQDTSCCDISDDDINVTITNDTVQYTLKRCSEIESSSSRVVYKDDVVCAFIEDGTLDGGSFWEEENEEEHPNTYRITISPGIDQCFIIMLCCICHQIDKFEYQMEDDGEQEE
jgi:hypothetical protein